MTEKKQQSQNEFTLKAMITGTIIGVITMSILLAIFAEINAVLALPEFFVGAMALITIALGSLVGGFFAGKVAKSNGIVIGFLVGIVLSAIILIGGMSIFDQVFSAFSLIKMTLAMIFCIAGGIFGVNSKAVRRK
jgi:putative membrane protein (TIGR04086 family)